MTDLDEFVRGYVETALWAEPDLIWEEDTSLYDAGYGPNDVSEESIRAIREECADFLAHHGTDVAAYCEQLGDWHGSDSVRGSDARYTALERAGGDFYLTRNGHGAGYWDRGLPEDLSWRLTDAANAYGETHFYRGDDEEIHVA